MKKNYAFTLSEALIVMVIIGIIATLLLAAIKAYNPTLRGNINKGRRVQEEIDQALILIIAEKTSDGTLTFIKDGDGSFSIEDNDAAHRLAMVFKDYVSYVDDANIINYKHKKGDRTKYFNSNILNFNSSSTGKVLKNTFSDFMISTDGVIWGFKTYKSCSAKEELAAPPGDKAKYTVSNICGSIFYDVNAYKGPNKLGFDQFVIPINTIGTYLQK